MYTHIHTYTSTYIIRGQPQLNSSLSTVEIAFVFDCMNLHIGLRFMNSKTIFHFGRCNQKSFRKEIYSYVI